MLTRLLQSPERMLALICTLQLALWTLAPALTHHAPPLDVVESYLWGREWVWATYKHPSFPGWALETTRILFGVTGWPAYLLSQIAVVATYLLVYRLGVDLFGSDLDGRQKALAGVLLLTALYYMSLPTPEWNHNVPQIPLYAGVIWALWRATRRKRDAPSSQRAVSQHTSWIALGLVAGVGMHVKYSFAVVLIVAAVWILGDRRGAHLRGLGPWLGLLVFLILVAPQLAWLIDNNFAPAGYAGDRLARANASLPVKFLLAQIADHAAVFVLAIAAGLILWRRPNWAAFRARLRLPAEKDAPGGNPATASALSAPPAADHEAARHSARRLRFLLLMGLGPALLTAAFGLILGARLKDMWGFPMFTVSGLLIVAIALQHFTDVGLRRLAAGALAIVTCLPIGYGLAVASGETLRAKPMRQHWPQAVISARFDDIWREYTDAPLRIVAGDTWTAGVVALDAPDLPSILTKGALELSPWVTTERLAQDGALLVWTGRAEAPPSLARLAEGATGGIARFDWPRHPTRAPLEIHYRIKTPQP